IGWLMYTFHYEQHFVKNFGGVMSIDVPKGQMHLQATWKDDNLWVENYDPQKNICIFSEYSKGNLLEGRVTIKNCNPFRVNSTAPNAAECTVSMKKFVVIEKRASLFISEALNRNLR